jgi:hypothetical protein
MDEVSMPISTTELFLRVALSLDTLRRRPALAEELPKALVEAGEQLWGKTLHTVEHLIERRDDFTAHNQVSRSVVEVEEWLGAILWRLEQALGEPLPTEVRGDEIEAGLDEWVVPLRVWRLIASLRTRPDLWQRLLAARPRMEDDLQRGYALMLKSIKLLDKLYQIKDPAPAEARYMAELGLRKELLGEWFGEFSAHASQALRDAPEALGLLGMIPEALAMPFGGTAFDVHRHRKAQVIVEDKLPSPPCSGWGVGASGNKENYWERHR